MKFLNKADNVLKKVGLAERVVGAFLLFVMLVVCFMAVVMRYVFNSPIQWSDEIILILLVGFGYICISVDVYKDEHVAITFFYDKLSWGLQRALDVFRHVLIGVFFALSTYYGVLIYQIKAPKTLVVTGASQGLVYLAEFIICGIIVIFCIMNVAKVLTMKKPEETAAEIEEKEDTEE